LKFDIQPTGSLNPANLGNGYFMCATTVPQSDSLYYTEGVAISDQNKAMKFIARGSYSGSLSFAPQSISNLNIGGFQYQPKNIVYNYYGYIITCDNYNGVLKSTDGITWTPTPLNNGPANLFPYGNVFNGNVPQKLVATGNLYYNLLLVNQTGNAGSYSVDAGQSWGHSINPNSSVTINYITGSQ
jgi:hypothetical protein